LAHSDFLNSAGLPRDDIALARQGDTDENHGSADGLEWADPFPTAPKINTQSP